MFEIVGPVLAITLITVLFCVVGMLYGRCCKLKLERDLLTNARHQWKASCESAMNENKRLRNELEEVRRLKDGYETALLEFDRWLSERPLKQDQTPKWLKGASDETA